MHRVICMLWGLYISASLSAESVYKHAFIGTPLTLDPVAFSDLYANKVASAIYDCLYQYKYLKSPLELKPMLARAMPQVSKDGLTLRIPLKKNIIFADDPAFPNAKGRELVAEDFVYSMKRHFDPKYVSTSRWMWADTIVGLDEWGQNGGDYKKSVEGLRALDRYTIEIRLKKPYPQFIHTLALGNAAIVPQEAVEKYGKELAFHPVGSGPWKLSSFDMSKAVLVKNPNYRKEAFDPYAEGYNEAQYGFTGIAKLAGKFPPFVDKIEIYFLEQDSTLWNSFTKGNEVQFGTVPVLQFHKIVKSTHPLILHKPYSDRYKASEELESAYHFFAFNMENPEIGNNADPIRNKRNRALRCAIRKAYNWQQLINRVFYGLGKAFPGIVPPNIQGFDPTLSRESVELDIEGAKKLMKEHGWNAANLPKLRYSGFSSVINKQQYEMFKGWMSKIGYPPEKISFDMYAQFGDYAKVLHEKKVMTLSVAWFFDFPDAQNSYQLYYGPHSSPGSNVSNYRNAEYDKLFEQASILDEGEERSRIYRRMNEILLDDCVVISGYARTRIHMWHKNVIIYPVEFSSGDYFRYVAVE